MWRDGEGKGALSWGDQFSANQPQKDGPAAQGTADMTVPVLPFSSGPAQRSCAPFPFFGAERPVQACGTIEVPLWAATTRPGMAWRSPAPSNSILRSNAVERIIG